MGRAPRVAGLFYESDGPGLSRQVWSLFAGGSGQETPSDEHAVAILVPHAGYAFSGPVAGRTYARVPVPERVVILAPNHTGLGRPAAIGLDSPWETPLGPVEVDRDLAERAIRSCPGLAADDLAHIEEHAIEVHLPFLMMRRPGVRFVPICLRTMSFPACQALGESLAALVRDDGGPILIVVSSDLNHHEPLAVAARKDRMVLDRIQELDAPGLYHAVVTHHISMCGFIPATVALIAAKGLGACHAEVVGYATSADVNGDESSVVGYAGVILTRSKPTMMYGSLTGARGAGLVTR